MTERKLQSRLVGDGGKKERRGDECVLYDARETKKKKEKEFNALAKWVA